MHSNVMKSDFQQNYVREYLPQKLRVTCNWRGHVDLTLPRKGTSTLFSRAVFWPLRSHLPTSVTKGKFPRIMPVAN